MAAALECWSSRATTTDDDMVEQVLVRSHHRSEGLTTLDPPSSTSSSNSKDSSSNSVVHKKLQKLTRNVSEAIASLKNTLNLQDSNTRDPLSSSSSSSTSKIEGSRKVVWGCVVRNLTQLYPGSQLPEKLMSNIRRHYDSLPVRSGSPHHPKMESNAKVSIFSQNLRTPFA